MNAANEVAVYAFLEGRIKYLHIVNIVECICEEHKVLDATDLESILEADNWARKRAQERIRNS
jgi:1-deoxy-D-xylulose-5-phosphate reductoisomerase